MKKNSVLLSLSFLILFLSCTKTIDHTPQKSVEENLVNKAWKVRELTFVENNQLFYYLRGGQNNTANYFDRNTLLFKKDRTGIYTEGDNVYNITWDFNSADKSKIKYTIYNYTDGQPASGVNSTVNLENVNVSATTLRYAEIYTHSNQTAVISSVERIYEDVK